MTQHHESAFEMEGLETDLELNRSAHHWDEGSRSLSPEDRVCAAVEVVE
jgi:hypothetical protein